MKHTLAIVALALSGVTFTTSPVFAETRNSPPNAVDVSQWLHLNEEPTCYTNGVRTLLEIFVYSNSPLYRRIERFYERDKVIYERHYVEFDGEKKI